LIINDCETYVIGAIVIGHIQALVVCLHTTQRMTLTPSPLPIIFSVMWYYLLDCEAYVIGAIVIGRWRVYDVAIGIHA
jgi:hypothetical protein